MLRHLGPGPDHDDSADPADDPLPAGSVRGRPGSIVVTGGAGYIGSHVALALLGAGWPVVILDDLSTGRLRPMHDLCQVVIGDVGDRGLVRAVLEAHDVIGVVHMAGSIVVPESVRRPLGYYGNNTIASHSLIRACVEHGIGAFVFSSTAAVYGQVEVSPVPEDAPTRPASPYGASKLMVEQMLRDAGHACDLPYAVLRYFNVAGADPLFRCGQNPGGSTHLLKVACEVALGERPALPVYGTDWPTRDGTCVRDFIHVSDLAAAHALALDYLLAGGRSTTLNCGYGRGYSVREVVAAVGRVAGRPLPTADSPRRPGDAGDVVAANERLRATLGWEPRHAEIDTVVRHALAWERLLRQERAREAARQAA